MKKFTLKEIEGKKIKATNGNTGIYATWEGTASGIRIWLEDSQKNVIGSILLKDIKKFED